jgi:CRP/FNR family cyclic AMP-dependent transcriptional regulator
VSARRDPVSVEGCVESVTAATAGHYCSSVIAVADLLAAVPLLESASSSHVERLAEVSFPRRLKRGQILVREGQTSDLLFVVLSGRLKVMVGSARGEALGLAVVGPGEVLGEFGAIDSRPRSANVEAIDAAHLICIPADAYRALLEASPAVSLALAEELAARIRTLMGSAADLVFLDVPRRLAKLLLAAPATEGLTLSQTDIAEQLGSTRSSVNRALTMFQRQGWVETTRHCTTVVDRDGLEAFGED